MNLAASRLLQTGAPWTFGLFLVLAGCEQRRVDVGGYRLWTAVAGRGSPTVVFEAGGGDDASVWLHIEPEVRRRLGVRTFRYDRAGLGKSDPSPGPYRIDDEAVALERALDRRGVRGPIVLVAHSYGGFVATLVAASDTRMAGVVLVDANLSGFFDAPQASRLVARYTPQFDALERARPALAHVMVPLMRALPETARRVREMIFPPALPTIDIVAERPWVEAPDEVAAMQRAHASFVAASPAREAVFASGSGHYVMRDRPDLVIDAIVRTVQRVRGR